MWLRKVPLLLATSLTAHCPSVKLNSQCLRLTTFDLNPTGASEGALGFVGGGPSLSEYRPTRMMVVSFGRVREIGVKLRDGLPSLL